MVSPVYKGGYGVVKLDALASEPGEEAANGVVFTSQGSFGGVPSNKYEFSYLARRGVTGWSTLPLEAPSTLSPDGGTIDLSPDLRSSVFYGLIGPNTGAAQYGASEAAVFRHDTDLADVASNWETVAVLKRAQGSVALSISPEGASLNQCHFVMSTFDPRISLLPQAEKAHERLYDLRRGGDECGGESYLRFVGLNNKEKLINASCGVNLGATNIENNSRQSDFNAISADGSELFFTALVGQDDCIEGAGAQLFVRLDGTRTVEVSKPLTVVCNEVPCSGANERTPSFFEGASEDGATVFFTTAQPLVEEDKDVGNDLYMATIGCTGGEACSAEERGVTSLVQVSHIVGGEAADVERTVRVAPDGSRVYFVAHGILTSSPNALEQTAIKGADNLYVYDVASGSTAFVAQLCSGPELSGEVDDTRCPSNLDTATGGRNDKVLWEGGARVEAQSTHNGNFLVFSSYAQLVRGDTDGAKDVYRYDAETGAIDRVSLGEEGADANGNGDEGPIDDATIQGAFVGGRTNYEQREAGTRAISENGSRIVFESAEALSESAASGRVNIYEWQKSLGTDEGSVSLISSATSPTDDCCGVISLSGSDIVLRTAAGLAPQDVDGVNDLYDARLGGGFPPIPVPPEECSADSCQGPLTPPLLQLVPASSTQAPGENLPTVVPKPKPKIKLKTKTKRKSLKGKKHKVRRESRALGNRKVGGRKARR